MASTTKNKAVVEFDANTKAFNAGLKQANSALTELRSELRLNKTEAQGAGDSMENLANRQKILTSEIEAQQQKIGLLTDRLDEARQAFGDGSIMVQKLQTQLNNASSAQAKMQQELSATNSALDEMEQASAQASSAMGRLESDISSQEAELKQLKTAYSQVALEQGESSDEARQLASQIQRTSSELQDNKTKMQQAESAADKFDRTLDSLGDTAQDTGNDFGAMDVALGDFVSDMAQNALGSLASFEEETRQYRLEQSKLDAQMVNSGKVTKEQIDYVGNLSDEYLGFYRLTGDETLSSTAAANMLSMGLSVRQTNDMLRAGSGIWAQYGDSIPLDGLMESVNETANTATVTGNLADALNWAAKSNIDLSAAMSGNTNAQNAYNKAKADGMSNEDAFNEALKACTTEQERQQLIVDTLNGAYGTLGDTYNDLSSEAQNANQSQAWLTEAQAGLADAVAPVVTQFNYLIGDCLMWLSDNLPIVVPLVAGLATAFAGFFIVNTILPAIQGFMTALSAAPTVLAAIGGPATIVIALVAALAAGFVYLWNTSETFRNGVMQIWATIQQVFGTLAEWLMTNVVTPIVTYFSSLTPQLQAIWSGIQNLINVAMGLISGFISSNMGTIQAIWSTIWGAVSGVASTVWGVIQTVISTALNVIQGIIQTVTAIMQGDWEGALNGILNIASSIWNGISSLISGIINGIASTISSVLSGISGTVSSILSGISGFFSDNFGAIGDTVSSVIDTAKNVVSGGLDAISGFFRGVHLELPKIKLPHFSISGSFSLNPPSIPHIGVSWYAQGGILEQPTIFGASGSNLLAGGEAGPEAVAPISDLLYYMMEALDAKFGPSDNGALIDAIEDLADRVISIEINGKQLARATASDNDRASGSRQKLINRGVSLA